MDTIQIGIKLNMQRVQRIFDSSRSDIKKFINSIRSPYGHTYCDFSERTTEKKIILKISYPRFFAGINVFLITNRMECMQVQHEFSLVINNHPLLYDAKIKLDRVDIPFTFHMNPGYNFNSYRKIYQIFDYVYRKKYAKASPTAITDIKRFKAETMVYSDTPSTRAYNSKIMIYDQYKNISTKTKDESNFCEIDAKYDDLSRRMRIEVSKRIVRKEMPLEGFRQFDIFAEYFGQYKKYILEKILDLYEVENFYNEKSQELANKLTIYRDEVPFFNYENFIYKEIEHIYDYEIIRRALKLCIENQKTREKAITTIRKVLFNYQLNENIIVMETFNTILSIRDVIENYFIG